MSLSGVGVQTWLVGGTTTSLERPPEKARKMKLDKTIAEDTGAGKAETGRMIVMGKRHKGYRPGQKGRTGRELRS